MDLLARHQAYDTDRDIEKMTDSVSIQRGHNNLRIRWPRLAACPNCGLPPLRDNGLCDESGAPLGPFSVECPYRLPPTYEMTCNQWVSAETPRAAARQWNALPVQPPLLRGLMPQEGYS